MSKPVKKTDQNKAWNRRKKAISNQEVNACKTFLVVCEGQTEELYFKAFQRDGVNIKCFWMGCTKLELVECTIDLKAVETYNEVWTVFDMDFDGGGDAAQLSKFDNAIDKAIKNDIKVAYSNDAFELWFYLHYQYTEQQNLRFFYYEQLSKYWDINYEKEGKARGFASKIFKILEEDERADLSVAIERASKLHEKMSILPYHQQNPATQVFLLVRELMNLL